MEFFFRLDRGFLVAYFGILQQIGAHPRLPRKIEPMFARFLENTMYLISITIHYDEYPRLPTINVRYKRRYSLLMETKTFHCYARSFSKIKSSEPFPRWTISFTECLINLAPASAKLSGDIFAVLSFYSNLLMGFIRDISRMAVKASDMVQDLKE